MGAWPVVWIGLDAVYAYEGGAWTDPINPGSSRCYPPSPSTLRGPGEMIRALAPRLATDAVVLIGQDVCAAWQLGDAPRAERARQVSPHWLTAEIARASAYHGKLSYPARISPAGKFQDYDGPARAWTTLTNGSGRAERTIRLGMTAWMDKGEAAEVGVYLDDPDLSVHTGGAARAYLGAPLCQSPGMTGILSLRAEPAFMATRQGRKEPRVNWWPDNWASIPPASAAVPLGFEHRRQAEPHEERAHVMAMDVRRASLRAASGIEVGRDKLYYRPQPPPFTGEPGYYLYDTRPLRDFARGWLGMPDPWAGCPQGHGAWERWLPHTRVELLYKMATELQAPGGGGLIDPDALDVALMEAWTTPRRERLGTWASRVSKALDATEGHESSADLAAILKEVYRWTWDQLGSLKGITQRPDIRDAVHGSLGTRMWMDAWRLHEIGRVPLRWSRDTVWYACAEGEEPLLPLTGPSGGVLGGWKVAGGGPVPYQRYAAARTGEWWIEDARRARREAREALREEKYRPGTARAGKGRRVAEVPFTADALKRAED